MPNTGTRVPHAKYWHSSDVMPEGRMQARGHYVTTVPVFGICARGAM